jgi:hypothetical protein
MTGMGQGVGQAWLQGGLGGREDLTCSAKGVGA